MLSFWPTPLVTSHTWRKSEENQLALAKNIKKNAQLQDSLPAHSATIIDGMALVQCAKFDDQQPAFEEIAGRIFAI